MTVKRNFSIRYILTAGLCLLMTGCGTSQENPDMSRVAGAGIEEVSEQSETERTEETSGQPEIEMTEEVPALEEPTLDANDSFTPQCFTKEQAEDIVERFGTDENGNPIQLFIHADENGYILAESSERSLSEEEVKKLTRYELYMAIQEIYARHGKKFSDITAAQYFNRQSWYMPYEKVFSKETLSDVEKSNIRLLSKMGNLTQEAEPDYGSLYPIPDKQGDMLTGEEAIIIIKNAFDMADEVITAREENYLEEKYEGDFKYYSLGEYSDKERLRSYLSSWFLGDAIDYVINIYGLCGGLDEDENGSYQLLADVSYFGDMQEIDFYKAAEVRKNGEECIVSVPFIDDKAGWGPSAIESAGEICLQKVGGEWVITSMSQTYYDALYQEYLEYIED